MSSEPESITSSLKLINQLCIIYVGIFLIVVGLVSSCLQILIFTTVRYYRTTPCTFYFIIASIHECSVCLAAYCPLVIAAFLGTEMTHLSAVWCKLSYFIITSCCAISTHCAFLATIDQFLVTSQHTQLQQISTIKNAHRAAIMIMIIWWTHGTLWLYYRDISPISGYCAYRSTIFFAYAVLFLCVIVCGIPSVIMIIFGILTRRNIKKTVILSRFRFDRQLTIIVYFQVLLTVTSVVPYGIFSVYKIFTNWFQKSPEQVMQETLIGNMAYLFGSVAYGTRFYVFLYSSSRFRRIVKDRILWWRRRRQIFPVLK